jgi:GTPase
MTSLISLIAGKLASNTGELLLCIGPHNASATSLRALFHSTVSTGNPMSIPDETQDAIVTTLREVCASISAHLSVLHPSTPPALPTPDSPHSANDEAVTKRWTPDGLRVMIRLAPRDAQDITELRVAVVGNVDAGKSTLLGVLTKGMLDDGRGRVRV